MLNIRKSAKFVNPFARNLTKRHFAIFKLDMYVKFKKLRFKNFLSYGNGWTELEFSNKLCIINAQNGSGKSTIIDAISHLVVERQVSRPRTVEEITALSYQSRRFLFTSHATVRI